MGAGSGQPRSVGRIAFSIAVAILLILSFSYLSSLDALGSAFSPSRIGSRVLTNAPLQQLISVSQNVPPFSLLLILLVPPFLYGYLRKPTRADAPIIVVSCLIVLLIICTFAITRASTLGVLIGTPVCCVLTCVSFFSLGTFIYALIYVAFHWLMRTMRGNGRADDADGTTPDHHESMKRFSPLRWGLVAFGIILLGWIPYLIVFFPGTMCYDAGYQLAQLTGIVPFTTEHPVFSTYIYGGLYLAGESIGGPNGGVLALALMQYLTMSAALGFEVFLIVRLGAPKWALLLSIAFFAISPTFGDSAQWCMKDALFAALFVVYTSLIVLCVKERERFLDDIPLMVALTTFGLLCALLRSNGIFVIGLSLPFICIFARGWKGKLRALIPFVLCILIAPTVPLILNAAVGTQPSNGDNMLSVPLQQIARVVALNDDLTDQERSYVENALGVEDIKELYDPELSDQMKGLYRAQGQDASLGDLLRTWTSIGVRHPIDYLDSMMLMTYGYLGVVDYPEYENAIAFFTQPGADTFGYDHVMPQELRDEAADFIEAFQDFPGLGVLGQPAFFTWLVMVEIAFLLFAHRRSELVMMLPVAILILTILVGPVNGSIRYYLPIMAVAPIMLWSVVARGPGSSRRRGWR